MSDYIRRDAAINTALNMYHRCNGSLEDYRALMVESLEVLTGMPETGRWIPCEEILPETEVLCCDNRKNQIIGYVYEDEESDTGYSAENEGVTMYNCIAWMPLPEPYKGEE